ncbi:MAG TPA: hypothetical protein VMB72_04910, partial [Acidimicrobiales bacterium]|nr:hypothetical protein [Acidimicrobiales bacterium]
MGRSRTVAARMGLAGLLLCTTGLALVGTVVAQVVSSSAYADTTPFELYCTNTPIGDLVLNDAVITGTLSPAAPTPGQQFSLEDFQIQTTVPPDIVQAATAVGNTAISGTVTTTVDATGATPSSQSTGSQPYDQSIPSPLPAAGLALSTPSSPLTVGPFTATSSAVTLSLGSSISLTFSDVAIPSGFPPLQCAAYPNDVMPSGFATGLPPGLPISPVIATAGGVTPPPTTSSLTGAYELFCPGTPVGDLVFNDVTTSAAITPAAPAAGGQFKVDGYQTDIPVPAGPVTAATGLGNAAFDGVAASAVDAYGAGPSQIPTGSMDFDVPIPDPVPSGGLALDLPSSPATVGPFTASGGPVTIAQDDQMLVVAELSSKAFTMTCTAYPNDAIPTSGSTGAKPDAGPIRPVIAMADATGTATTTTITSPPGGGAQVGTVAAGQPYELFCPSTPVGDIAVNDVTSSATIAPQSSPLTAGETFGVTGLAVSLTLPQSVVTELEQLGLSDLSGSVNTYLDVSGTAGYGDIYPVPVSVPPEATTTTSVSTGPATTVPGSDSTTTTTPASGSDTTLPVGPGGPDTTLPVGPGGPDTTVVVGWSGSSPGGSSPTTVAGNTGTSVPVVTDPGGPAIYEPDLPGPTATFSVQLPNPVPAGGVTVTATEPAGDVGPQYVAEGGPIQAAVDGVDLQVQAFGDSFGFFCNPYPNDAEAEGLSVHFPQADPVEAVLATGSATMPTPQPGGEGPYELYCPSTPVGDIVLNDVTSAGTMSPADPAPGQQFDLTGYQTTFDLPEQIAAAAAALGNSAISGTATTSVEATGATPAGLSSGTMGFDVPLPSPVPAGGLAVAVPSVPATLGPFTATGGSITLAQGTEITLTLDVSGSTLTLSCTTYPNDSAPTGIVSVGPVAAPTSPVIATTAPTTGTSGSVPPPSSTTTEPGGSGDAAAVAAIDQAYATVFDPSASASARLADIEDGSAIKGAFVAAMSSSLASTLAGAAVESVTFPDAATCSTQGLTSPCAELTYEILGTGGVSLLGDERGWAVEEGGTWLVGTNTVCSLLGLFYQAEGKTGTPPGCPGSSTTTSTTPTTTTPGESGAEAAIDAVFDTVFDLSGPIGPKIADIQDGASIESAFSTALDSNLAANAGGATVTAVTFPDASGCTAAGLPSPCAQVTFTVDSTSGNALLPDDSGWAVEVDGTWLMAKTTVCGLLDLFWQASGSSGSPPGCQSSSPPTTASPVVGTTGSGSLTTVPASPVSASTGVTATSDPPTTAGATATTTPGASTTATPGTTGPADPPRAASPSVKAAAGTPEVTTAPVVEASSGSLAFTGLGGGTIVLGATGAVLALVGAVLLVLADAPRRLVARLTPGPGGGGGAAGGRRP